MSRCASSPGGRGTRLELIHSGWERLGEQAKKPRRSYPLEWTCVLNCWAGRRRSATNLLLDGVIIVLQGVRRARKGKST
jgi:hypothetical protein